jgi:hypothetical protein
MIATSKPPTFNFCAGDGQDHQIQKYAGKRDGGIEKEGSACLLMAWPSAKDDAFWVNMSWIVLCSPGTW